MTERMDMALDDIISKNKGGNRRGGRGGRGSRGGRGGGRRNNNNNDDKMELGTYAKEDSNTGGAFRRARMGKKFNKPYTKKETNEDTNMNGEEEEVWGHDLYEQQQDGKDPNIEFPHAASNLSLDTGTKIRVENLEYGVAESDLKELFESVGTVKKAKVHYDRSGRSKGSADIIFTRKTDAETAVNKYNNVELDGKVMKITLVGSALASKLGTFTVSARGGQRRVLSNRSIIRGGRRGRGRGNVRG